jgi:twitching motility protein PilT
MSDYVPDPKISRLVRELNLSARADVRREEGPSGHMDLERLLQWSASRGATDLLLLAGSEPAARIRGELALVGGVLLSTQDLWEMAQSLLDEKGLQRLERERSLDLGFEREGVGRFRCNLHFQRGTPALAIRLLPERIPSLDQLHLPESLIRLVELRRGLVLVTGPSGSGKSTTLASLLTAIAGLRQCHILTIEDPIEYRLDHGRSLVEQVEVGRDAPSFAVALRAALRQDPDVIMVGEMRDLETISIALTAAETGHLVLSTLHTGDTAQALERVIDVFPPDRHQQLRVQVAGVLRAIVSQILLPGVGETAGRYPACEVLLATDAVRHKIRKGETHQLHHEITLGKTAGMVTLEESLAGLVRDGLVDLDEAASWVVRREEFEELVGEG